MRRDLQTQPVEGESGYLAGGRLPPPRHPRRVPAGAHAARITPVRTPPDWSRRPRRPRRHRFPVRSAMSYLSAWRRGRVRRLTAPSALRSAGRAAPSARGAGACDAWPCRANRPLPRAPSPRSHRPPPACCRGCASARACGTAARASRRDRRRARSRASWRPRHGRA